MFRWHRSELSVYSEAWLQGATAPGAGAPDAATLTCGREGEINR